MAVQSSVFFSSGSIHYNAAERCSARLKRCLCGEIYPLAFFCPFCQLRYIGDSLLFFSLVRFPDFPLMLHFLGYLDLRRGLAPTQKWNGEQERLPRIFGSIVPIRNLGFYLLLARSKGGQVRVN